MGRNISIRIGAAAVAAVFVCLLATSGFAQPKGKGPGGGNFIENFDANGDGKVAKSEFGGPAEHFTMFDKNEDGFITKDEAPTGPPGGKGGKGPKGQGGPPAT